MFTEGRLCALVIIAAIHFDLEMFDERLQARSRLRVIGNENKAGMLSYMAPIIPISSYEMRLRGNVNAHEPLGARVNVFYSR